MSRGDDPADGEQGDDEFEAAEPIDAEEAETPTAVGTEGVESPDAPGPARPASPPDTAKLTDDDGRLLMPVETLSVLNWLGEIGVDGVEARLNRAPVAELSVRTEQVKVDYAGPATVRSQFGAADRAGARVGIEAPFTGTVLVLFPVRSAQRAASLMLRNAVEDAESVVTTPMGRDALTELCNMMANGFVDAWASVFDAHFDTGPPVAVQNPELTLLHEVFSASELGLYLSARLRVPQHDVSALVFVFPGEEQFVTKLSQVRPETVDR